MINKPGKLGFSFIQILLVIYRTNSQLAKFDLLPYILEVKETSFIQRKIKMFTPIFAIANENFVSSIAPKFSSMESAMKWILEEGESELLDNDWNLTNKDFSAVQVVAELSVLEYRKDSPKKFHKTVSHIIDYVLLLSTISLIEEDKKNGHLIELEIKYHILKV